MSSYFIQWQLYYVYHYKCLNICEKNTRISSANNYNVKADIDYTLVSSITTTVLYHMHIFGLYYSIMMI